VKLRWLRSGSESLKRHVAYITSQNPVAAQNVRRTIRDSVLRLCEFPESGRNGHVAGTRELIVAGLPYVVVYRISSGTVEIMLVLHTAMDRPSLGH
jgi:toxin ParE1/3/4